MTKLSIDLLSVKSTLLDRRRPFNQKIERAVSDMLKRICSRVGVGRCCVLLTLAATTGPQTAHALTVGCSNGKDILGNGPVEAFACGDGTFAVADGYIGGTSPSSFGIDPPHSCAATWRRMYHSE